MFTSAHTLVLGRVFAGTARPSGDHEMRLVLLDIVSRPL